MDNIFAFIAHPLAFEQVVNLFPASKIISRKIINKTLLGLPPKIFHRVKINFNNKTIEGIFVLCPLLPKQFKKQPTDIILRKISKCVEYSERQGAKIIGLGAYTSVIGDKGITIANNAHVPITTGNSYTVWAAVEACLQIARKRKMNLSSAKACVIGATGSIGSACAQLLSRSLGRISLCAPNIEKLNLTASKIYRECKVDIESDPLIATNDADIILAASNAPKYLIKTSDLKSNSIVCDVATPPNIFHDSKDSIFYFKGGLVIVPFCDDFRLGNFDPNLPDNVVFSCIAETMLLALEKRYENFSIGPTLSMDRIQQIAGIASKYGLKSYIKFT